MAQAENTSERSGEGSVSSLTVVVPVFNAHDCLRACLASLDAHSPGAPVLLVDDASEDPRIKPLLVEWVAQRPGARLISLPENRGFVHAANRGVAEVAGDVVLLNSDTRVTTGWLEALTRCLASDPRIATATPWSNNAEIVSLPEACVANPAPEDPEPWASAVRAAARGHHPELPTGVGFCMAVSRAAIDALGFFDEAVFGRGYGEENDFCRRAADAGWRNVLCEDAFVVHEGGQSFGPLGLKPGGEAMERLLGRHPDYLRVVEDWIRQDPLADRRAAIVASVDTGASKASTSGRIGTGVARDRAMTDGMDFTGERFTPECVREIWYEHQHRYAFAAPLCAGRRVLDAACGEGYGSALLAGAAAHVDGVDVSPEAVAHARRRYGDDDRLDFHVADVTRLPFDDDTFERIVSFETLEHLEAQDAMLAEFRRVLAPGGLLIVSSPDKAVYTDQHGNDNEFHVKELYRDELESLLARHFPAVRLLGQKLLFHSAIWDLGRARTVRLQQAGGDRLDEADTVPRAAMYFIALCSDGEANLPELDGDLWLFDDAEESVYTHYHGEIRRNMAAGGIIAERDREIERLRAELEARDEGPAWWARLFGRRGG